MGGRLLNGGLLLALIASVSFLWTRRPDPARPNFDYLPEMVYSPAPDAFAPNSNFADGKTLQAPVPGTIPQGYLPLRYQATPADAARAAEELENPFQPESAKDLERGSVVFRNFCAPCHGLSGRGDGPVSQRGYPPPPSLLAGRAVNMKEGQMFHVLSFGQGNMPSYATQLTREDRWKVILYLRTLPAEEKKRSAALPGGTASLPPASGEPGQSPPPAQEGRP